MSSFRADLYIEGKLYEKDVTVYAQQPDFRGIYDVLNMTRQALPSSTKFRVIQLVSRPTSKRDTPIVWDKDKDIRIYGSLVLTAQQIKDMTSGKFVAINVLSAARSTSSSFLQCNVCGGECYHDMTLVHLKSYETFCSQECFNHRYSQPLLGISL